MLILELLGVFGAQAPLQKKKYIDDRTTCKFGACAVCV